MTELRITSIKYNICKSLQFQVLNNSKPLRDHTINILITFITFTITIVFNVVIHGSRTKIGSRGLLLLSLQKRQEKIRFKWVAYHNIAENLTVWKLQTASLSLSHPVLTQQQKMDLKQCDRRAFPPSFPCTSGVAPETS